MKLPTMILSTLAALSLVGVAQAFPIGPPGSPPGYDCPNPRAVQHHFGTFEGGNGFVPRFDLNDDGAVTVGDMILSANCWLEE